MKRWITPFIDDLKTMKTYLAAVTILFIAALWVGATNEHLHELLTPQLEQIKQLAEEVSQADNAEHVLFGVIVINNAVKAVMVVYLGILLGIYPILFTLLNGMMIGYVYELTEAGTGDALSLFLKGIVPHGVIEIPAILLASAYGIRFGVAGITALFNKGKGKALADLFRVSIPLGALLVILLLIAAVIEAYVTPFIMEL
ncbi:stage II sporulation protein M [Marinicrinis lubricantis]|uniref:Stage II sporulation protein M n=1 Tax=Marinicrinis lubricantis TaxID=2086470 RepID=A0ABW1IS98_9BACL